MNTHTYNGWTNYETWAVNLWITNDEEAYNYWLSRAHEIEAEVEPTQVLTKEQSVCYELATALEGEHKDGMPQIEGVYVDLLNAALSEINWLELATKFFQPE